MHRILRCLALIAGLALCAAPGLAAEAAKLHKVAIHVDQNDPDVMNMALNNASNVIEHYRAKGEGVEVEIVAYGPGLNMLRADKSPVLDRITKLAGSPTKIKFSACHNTIMGMEKREGHPITIVPQATVVPSGVVRLMELQEDGWAYVRP